MYGQARQEVEREFAGKGYGELKPAVGEAVIAVLKPLQDEVARLSQEKSYIDGIIKENAEKANYYAMKTLRKVQKKVRFSRADSLSEYCIMRVKEARV